MPGLSNLKACTGCLRCELACSFHHTGEFSRSGSSIQVRKSLSDDGIHIHVTRSADGNRPPCDLCKGEEIPFCIRFCPESVLTDESGHS